MKESTEKSLRWMLNAYRKACRERGATPNAEAVAFIEMVTGGQECSERDADDFLVDGVLMPVVAVNVETAAHLLGDVSVSTVRRRVRDRSLSSFKLGGRLLIARSELERFVAEQSKGAA